MLYKEYGKTGKNVSIIGFGVARLLKDDGVYNYDKCADIIVKASELGINFFDTSPRYLDCNSEAILGQALKEINRKRILNKETTHKPYIATKSMDKDGGIVRRELEYSLKVLDVPKIDFYHIQSVLDIEDYRSRFVPGGAYETVLKAKEEGLIDHICISTHCTGDEAAIIAEEGYFDGITLGYNIFNFPYRQKGIQAAYKNKLGVGIMNPLGGGVIPQRSDFFDFIKSSESETVIEAAMRFVASHKEVSTVISGIETMDQLIMNAKIGDNFNPIPQDKLDEIESYISKSLNELCTGCRYCEKCPNGVEVSKFMYAYNYAILGSPFEGADWITGHWWMTPDHALKCTACGICESRCTQHIPIIKRLKEISTWE